MQINRKTPKTDSVRDHLEGNRKRRMAKWTGRKDDKFTGMQTQQNLVATLTGSEKVGRLKG